MAARGEARKLPVEVPAQVSRPLPADPAAEPEPQGPAARAAPRRRRLRLSMLAVSILAVNVLALALLLGGLLYLDQYRESLVDAKTAALMNEAEIMAGALGQRAVVGDMASRRIDTEIAGELVRRFVGITRHRARVFGADGSLLIDSRELLAAGREVQRSILPPPDAAPTLEQVVDRLMGLFDGLFRRDWELPLYNEAPDQRADDYDESADALLGESAKALRIAADGSLVMSVAVPVQNFKLVLGALMISADDEDIEAGVREVRSAILRVFWLALAITVFMSLFLAWSIARPIRRLAEAADKVRHGYSRRVTIPDFSARHDEIGELSMALADMTESLYNRIDAIESFAADVAHEIKNPLTSIRSAVEAIERVGADEHRVRLLEIISGDVARLDRLISDISDASRLDAELSRAETVTFDAVGLLETLVEIQRTTAAEGGPRFVIRNAAPGPVIISGIEERIGQVVRNLLDNAVSFSPPGGLIELGIALDGIRVILTVTDEGPGLPEDNLEKVFERFYTLRPEAEAFGTHSGLGLSISRQIAEAHDGTIRAMNRRDSSGAVIGARFVVELPVRR